MVLDSIHIQLVLKRAPNKPNRDGSSLDSYLKLSHFLADLTDS